MAEVSIIIPIYNSAKYLTMCLNSIKKQTFKNIEVIMINDGSKDNSINICTNFCKNDNRFIIIDKENTGVSDCRNLGIKTAKSKYVMFVDADDWIEENAVEICYNRIKETNADICQFNYFFNYEDAENKREDFFDELIIRNSNSKEDIQCNVISPKYAKNKKNIEYFGAIRGCWSKMFSKKFLIENNIFFDSELVVQEDTYFFLKALDQMNKIIFINNYLYHYRQNNGSVTKTYDYNRLNKNLIIMEKFKNFSKSTRINKSINILFFELLIDYISKDVFNYQKKLKYKARKRKLQETLRKYYKNVISDLEFRCLTQKQKIIYILLKLKFYIFIYWGNLLKDKSSKRWRKK